MIAPEIKKDDLLQFIHNTWHCYASSTRDNKNSPVAIIKFDYNWRGLYRITESIINCRPVILYEGACVEEAIRTWRMAFKEINYEKGSKGFL